jgi:hypothetical protein
MRLEEVLPAFKDGKNIRRQSTPQGYFLGVRDKNLYVGFTLEDGRRIFASRSPVKLDSEDVLATDWEVVE